MSFAHKKTNVGGMALTVTALHVRGKRESASVRVLSVTQRLQKYGYPRWLSHVGNAKDCLEAVVC
jgi:hypothetical protein